MSRTLLHLVDDYGELAPTEVRSAVDDAFTSTCRRFPRCDEVYLANVAEVMARTITRNAPEIRSARAYAFAVMTARALEWLTDHPVEHRFTPRALERAAGAKNADEYSQAEWAIFFEQMFSQLSERDRQILALIDQGRGKPGDIATALHLSYDSAAKALQRTKDRVAQLGFGQKRGPKNSSERRLTRCWLPTHWIGVKSKLRGSE